MGNISIKLNLAGLVHATRIEKGQSGEQECLIIPIAKNNLFKGEKGLYLDLTAIELKNPSATQKDTHLIKQSLPKDVYEKMSDEEKKATPILGNAILWGDTSRNEPELSKPVNDGDDLPW